MKINQAVLLFSLTWAPSSVCSFTPHHVGKHNPLNVSILAGDKGIDSSTALSAETQVKPGSVGSLIQSTIKASLFVYTYGTIRRVVNNHDNFIRDGKPATEGLLGLIKKPLVDMYRPELVVTQRAGGGKAHPNRYMNYPVNNDNILEFLRNNRQFLKQKKYGDDVKFQQLDAKSEDLPELPIETNVKSLSRFDGDIVDYYDETTNKYGLVYGITLNRTMKRATVVFRGTVGRSDYWADVNFNHNREHFADLEENVKVHSGFSGYLFKEIEGEGRTIYDRIVASLKDIYDDLPAADRDDYKILVSGHSLGGALANLFAFTLSVREGGGDCPLFRYIRAVTFAGPVVGCSEYDRVFREQEKQDKLHLIRVSNEGDLVPTNPSPYDYTHNGVNMHVFDDGKEMEFEYGNKKSLFSQSNLDFLTKHMFPSYEGRIFQDDFLNAPNMAILDKTFDEVYQSKLN